MCQGWFLKAVCTYFNGFLEKNISFSVHNENIQKLALEMYQAAQSLTSSLLLQFSSTGKGALTENFCHA